MYSKSKQDTRITVTCKECGKTSGKGQTGTHWICEDCKVNEIDTSSNPDNEQQEK